jgi:hypothetical protein
MNKQRFYCERVISKNSNCDGDSGKNNLQDKKLKICGHIWQKEEPKEGEKKPVVILSHGFMANGGMCFDYARLLAGLGYVAVTFDFCGGGLMSRSDGKSEDMTLFTELEDLFAVIDYVKNLSYVNAEEITLLGCSQGGVVSAMAAKRLGDKIKGLILLYPALCIPDDARKGKMMFFKFDPENIPDVLGTFPMKLGGDYARTVINMDIYDEIKGFGGRVLYLHGTKDNIVNISYARKAKDLFSNCRYVEIEGGGHMFKGKAEMTARAEIAQFMKM